MKHFEFPLIFSELRYENLLFLCIESPIDILNFCLTFRIIYRENTPKRISIFRLLQSFYGGFLLFCHERKLIKYTITESILSYFAT